MQSRGGSDTLALPAGTKSVQEPEASVSSTTEAARGHVGAMRTNMLIERFKRCSIRRSSVFLRLCDAYFQVHIQFFIPHSVEVLEVQDYSKPAGKPFVCN